MTGRSTLVNQLQAAYSVLEEMTAEEFRHEAFFAACARTHRLARLSRVFGWRLPDA